MGHVVSKAHWGLAAATVRRDSEAHGETWLRIDNAFKQGSRDLAKSSLFLFLLDKSPLT